MDAYRANVGDEAYRFFNECLAPVDMDFVDVLFYMISSFTACYTLRKMAELWPRTNYGSD